jgi:ferredoxin
MINNDFVMDQTHYELKHLNLFRNVPYQDHTHAVKNCPVNSIPLTA